MKKTLLSLALSTLLAAPTFAEEASSGVSTTANSGFYLGGSYAMVNTEFEFSDEGTDYSIDFDLSALTLSAGFQLNEYLAFETRFGTGMADDEVTGADGDSVTLELDSIFGLYAKAGLPVSDKFYPYLVLGLTEAELSISSDMGTSTDSDSDTSFGVGASFAVNNQFAVFGEYMNWYEDDGLTISGFNLGVNYKF